MVFLFKFPNYIISNINLISVKRREERCTLGEKSKAEGDLNPRTIVEVINDYYRSFKIV